MGLSLPCPLSSLGLHNLGNSKEAAKQNDNLWSLIFAAAVIIREPAVLGQPEVEPGSVPPLLSKALALLLKPPRGFALGLASPVKLHRT